MAKGGKAHKRFRARLRTHYKEAEKKSKPSKVRVISGDALLSRKAELEERGLPPTKPRPVRPSRKKTYIAANDRQFFFPPGGRF